MNCADVQNQTPEYLEDMVPEEIRARIRTHLASCSTCQKHASRLSSFSGDLKLMGQEEIPFDLVRAVREELSRGTPPSSSWFKKTSVFILIFACVAGLWKADMLLKRDSKKIFSEEKQVIDDREAAAILQKLKETEASLERGAGTKASKRHKVASLDPFRWLLKFASASEREVFAAQLKRVNPGEVFHSQYFAAFSMDQSHLSDLMTLIVNSPASVTEGPKIDLKTLPQSEAPLQVMLLMEIEGNRDALFWRQLRFLRYDSYLFTRRLHDLGFKFLFESPYFVLLQVSPAEHQTLQLELGNTFGLETVRGSGNDFFQKNSQESFPVLLFLREG